MVTVTKFGGTSVANGHNLEQVIDIILANPKRRVNVFSGPGKRSKKDAKVTDLLIEIGTIAYSDEVPSQLVDTAKQRFIDITDYFHIGRSFLDPLFDSLDKAIGDVSGDKGKYLDGIKPYGEIILSEIAAEILRSRGLDAQVYRHENIGMKTDGNFGRARVKETSYGEIAASLKPVLEGSNEIIIIPGFYGVDEHGRYTTFPREGSDLTGAILANALDAELYENWTDTNGIRRADPRIVDDPNIIGNMTYKEARELAYSGAQVLHPDTLTPLIAKSIPLNVRNTFNPDNEGTYITVTKGTSGNTVEGIAHKDGFTIIYLEKTGMNEQIGYLQALGGIFAEAGVSIDQITTSVDSLAIAVASEYDNKIDAIRSRIIEAGLVDRDGIGIAYNKSLVCVVGEGMRHTIGVMQRLSSALANAGINIETVFQGPSERSIIFGVDQKDAIGAVRSIYNSYFPKPAK